jgi:flagellar basal-body rod protein FlgB
MQPTEIKSLEKFINYCAAKNTVISKNIANIGTENYKREDLEFSKIFNENVSNMMKTTNPKHMVMPQSNGPQFEITEDNSQENVSGVNNVDIDKEMSELAANSIQFRFASRKIGDYFKTLQAVIKGGGGI